MKLIKRSKKPLRVSFSDGAGTVCTSECRAERLVDRNRAWAATQGFGSYGR